jgi:hypothetical protein
MRLIVIALVLWPFAAVADDFPDAKLTPGACRTDLTQEQICAIKWGEDHRKVTAGMARQVFRAYGYAKLNTDPRCPCEIDHVCSRELGGADVIANLWPQSYRGLWNAHDKDRLENKLHKLMCAGTLSLQEAQDEIVGDWIASYQRHIAAAPIAPVSRRPGSARRKRK